jgi:hypothetical protein
MRDSIFSIASEEDSLFNHVNGFHFDDELQDHSEIKFIILNTLNNIIFYLSLQFKLLFDLCKIKLLECVSPFRILKLLFLAK